MSDEEKYATQNVDTIVVEAVAAESAVVEDANGDGVIDGVAVNFVEGTAVTVDLDSDGVIDGVAIEVVEAEYTAVDVDYDGVVNDVVVEAEVTTVVVENEYASNEYLDADDDDDDDDDDFG